MTSFMYSSRSLDLKTVVLVEELHFILDFYLLYVTIHELVNDQRLYSCTEFKKDKTIVD